MRDLRAIVVVAALAGGLAGCTTTPAQESAELATRAALPDAARLECALLSRARSETRMRTGQDIAGIAQGCPGVAPSAPAEPTTVQARLAAATGADLPFDSSASGPLATQLLEKMIRRGVPVAVAEDLSRTTLFRQAIDAATAASAS